MSIRSFVYVRDPSNRKVYNLGVFPSRNKAAIALADWLPSVPREYHFDLSVVKGRNTWSDYLTTPKGIKVSSYIWIGEEGQDCPFLKGPMVPIVVKPGSSGQVSTTTASKDDLEESDLTYSELYQSYLLTLPKSQMSSGKEILSIKEIFLKVEIWKYYHQKAMLTKLMEVYNGVMAGKHPELAHIDLNGKIIKAFQHLNVETLPYPLVPAPAMKELEDLLYSAETKYYEYCNAKVRQLAYLRCYIREDGSVTEEYLHYITIRQTQSDGTITYKANDTLNISANPIIDPTLLVISNQTGKTQPKINKPKVPFRNRAKKLPVVNNENNNDGTPVDETANQDILPNSVQEPTPILEPIPSNCAIKVVEIKIETPAPVIDWNLLDLPEIIYDDIDADSEHYNSQVKAHENLGALVSSCETDNNSITRSKLINRFKFENYQKYLIKLNKRLTDDYVPRNYQEVTEALERIQRTLKIYTAH